MIKTGLSLLLLVIASNGYAASTHQCAVDAHSQAVKLLRFHYDEADEKIGVDNIEDTVKVVTPLANPAGKGKFDVLEIWGNIYKGRYRMHFIYAVVQNQCVLMGQEILEYARI